MQNHVQPPKGRSNSLMMRRHNSDRVNGTAGGMGPNSLTLDINATSTAAPQHNPTATTKQATATSMSGYNTLPNNIGHRPTTSSIGGGPPLVATSTPLVGNHVGNKQPPWSQMDGDIRPISAVNQMSSPNVPPLRGRMTPLQQGDHKLMNPPTQRLSIINSGGDTPDPYDHHHFGMNGDMSAREYGSPDRFSERHSEDRFSVDRFSDHHPNQPLIEQPQTSSSAQFSARSPVQPPPSHQQPQTSRLSDTSDLDVPGAGSTSSLKRRKTMPSIVKHTRSYSASKINMPTKTPSTIKESSTDETDTFIIEDGVHKRIHAEVYARPPSPTPSITSTTSFVEEKPKELPKRYTVESTNLTTARNRGSLPDVRAEDPKTKKGLMPREEAHRLGEIRREQLRRFREQEEQRRKLEIVLRLADVKVSVDVCFNGIFENNDNCTGLFYFLVKYFRQRFKNKQTKI